MGLSAAFAALILAASPVSAPKDAAAGAWVFETQTYADGCKLAGEVVLVPSRTERGRYSCTVKARETCDGRGLIAQAEQTCTAVRTGDALRIESKVVSVKPPGISYAPDDFTLTIRSTSRMDGMMESFNSAPATFLRPKSAPIS
jgi:hypothetical protein